MGTINPSNNPIQPVKDLKATTPGPATQPTPASTPPNKPLPALPGTPKTTPGTNLANTQTIEKSLEQSPPPQEINQTAETLKPLSLKLQDKLATTLSVKDTTPPPQLSPQQLHQTLKTALGSNNNLRDFTHAQQGLVNAIKGIDQSSSGLSLVENNLAERLEQLDKKAKHYNSPLYKLADKLGIKNRKVKLNALQQQRTQAQREHQSLHKLQNTLLDTNQSELQRYSQRVQQELGQAFDNGARMVQQNQDNKGLMWSLGLQSKVQLKDTLSQSVLESFSNSAELTASFQGLQQDYQQAVDTLQEIKAKASLAMNRIHRFKSEIRDLKASDPAAADALQASFDTELESFRQTVLRPLIDKLPPEERAPLMANRGTTISIESCSKASHLNQQPPRLYQVLSDEQKAYVDQLTEGVQSALPNRMTGPDTLSLNGENYHQKTKIAQAGFAEIFTYTHVDTGEKIVVKQPIKNELMSEEEFQQVVLQESVNELQNHYHAMGAQGEGHPNLVKLIGAVSSDQGPLIAMEYIDSGDGHQFIQTKLTDRVESGALSETDQQTIHKHMLYQMMSGVQHMQERGMTHLDIKFDNFFLQSDGTLKVADLGLSKTTDQFLATREDRGDNPIYLAPELMIEKRKTDVMGLDYEVTNKADTWSVGVMAHKMLKGTLPFDSDFTYQIEEKIETFGSNLSNRVIEDPQSLEDEMLNLMLHPDPSQRPTLESLMQSPIFDSLFNTNDSGQRTGFKQDVLDLTRREIQA